MMRVMVRACAPVMSVPAASLMVRALGACELNGSEQKDSNGGESKCLEDVFHRNLQKW
jgi:hypothetical protein